MGSQSVPQVDPASAFVSNPNMVADQPLDRVIAPLNYLVDTGEKPVSYMSTSGIERTGRYEPYRVSIRNGRTTAQDFSLDREGFALVRHGTKHRDFFDADAVRRNYYPEMERLVRRATGASHVLVFDHNVRLGDETSREQKGLSAPVLSVHNDYTATSGPQRVRDLLPRDEAEARLARRFAIVNVWRPLVGPVESMPLALADARSIAPRDLITRDLVYPDRVGEVYDAAYNPDHRWFYFPWMESDEAILIKGYDSEQDGRARFTLHTAFDDPASPDNPAPRQSIEVRTLAFFD